MDFQFKQRKTGKDKERRTRELYGKHSAKHIRIQEHCQENHLKNLQEERNKNSHTVKSGKDIGKK
jgi:ribosomal protein S21